MKRSRMTATIAALVTVCALALVSASLGAAPRAFQRPGPAPESLQPPIGTPTDQYQTRPQQPVTNLTPHEPLATLSLQPGGQAAVAGTHAQAPRQMRLLVLTATGDEPAYAATTAFLDRLGVPYHTLVGTQQALTPDFLAGGDGTEGNYQGIILTTGTLGYEYAPGQWHSALTDAEWATLWDYEAAFGVRQVTLYTYPGSAPDSYGLTLVSEVDTQATPLQATLTEAGRLLFPYVKSEAVIPIRNAWAYLATAEDGVTPLLQTAEGLTLGVVKTYADGRENLALTFDHNPHLIHSLLLQYGVVNWVTRGLFIGERHLYLNVQVDDLLISDALWDTAALSDETGLEYRMTATDLQVTTGWKNGLRQHPAFAGWTFEWAFNGSGAAKEDGLSNAVRAASRQYWWINHTWDHMNLDAAAFEETRDQLHQNNELAKKWKLQHYTKSVLVTPDVSGLDNPAAMRGAYDKGVRFVVCDTSRAGCQGMAPNTGLYNPHEPRIFMIPRRPTNVFYNTSTPDELVSEYNHMYRWYWGRDLTYEELVDLESDVYLSYMLRFDANPLMFHQSNLRAYDGAHTLMGDVIDRTAAKYGALMSLPVLSLPMEETAWRMIDRLELNAAAPTAVLHPGEKILLTARDEARVPLTGLAYGGAQERYGSEVISWLTVKAGQVVTVDLNK